VKMDADGLRHQSRFSRASEYATRDAMRRAGSTEAEIDRALLVGNLQWRIFRNLLKIEAVLYFILTFRGWAIDFNWMTGAAAAVVAVALYVISFPIAKDHATRWEWVDVGGGYVRKDALETAAHDQR
jgi:hypothetical protein